MKHPRDQFLTIYGRKPVLEILENESLNIAKVFIARKAKADIIKNISFRLSCNKNLSNIQRLVL